MTDHCSEMDSLDIQDSAFCITTRSSFFSDRPLPNVSVVKAPQLTILPCSLRCMERSVVWRQRGQWSTSSSTTRRRNPKAVGCGDDHISCAGNQTRWPQCKVDDLAAFAQTAPVHLTTRSAPSGAPQSRSSPQRVPRLPDNPLDGQVNMHHFPSTKLSTPNRFICLPHSL